MLYGSLFRTKIDNVISLTIGIILSVLLVRDHDRKSFAKGLTEGRGVDGCASHSV